jgi:phosphoglycolate phosphatase
MCVEGWQMLKLNRRIPGEQIKLLIFDLDGTLVDSRLDLANAVNAMLVHYGRQEEPSDLIASYIGDGAPMLVRRALGDPDDEYFIADALNFFMAHYREHLLDTTYVYPGTTEALDRMKSGPDGQSRKMAVLSNKPVRPSQRIVDGLGLSPYFFQVYGGNSFHTKKPDPLGAMTLIREAGVTPEQTVMIGDSANDILTARAVGMWSIGLTYGLAPHQLEQAPPDILADSPAEMADALSAPVHAPER